MDKKCFYVLSTHWDREWYQAFQDYRYRLVGLFDEIIECLNNKELKGPFYTDGQSCVLEDYLEIRPDYKNEVKDKLQKGDIVSGPWYILPDEFLVSGESIVRNIELGLKTVRALEAKPSKAGFLCDMFGHISQMPQIFHLFGINAAFLWRGVNVDSRLIIWEGADGTCQPTYVCTNYGYADYAFTKGIGEAYKAFDEIEFRENLEKYLKKECDKTPINSILLFDGSDHQYFDRKAYRSLLKYFKENDLELSHVDMDQYLVNVQSEFEKIETTIKGQLRQVTEDYRSFSHLIFGVLSSRVDIKQENAYCQNMLCSWAEPYSVISSLSTDNDYPHGFLETAWKWLIKNHAHDSICGCSIDKVHEDMKFRFSQTRQISERVTGESLKSIALNIDFAIDQSQLKVVIFNPLPCELNDVISLKLKIPVDWPDFQEFFGFEKLPAFRIFDTEGLEIAYQRTAQQCNSINKVTQKTKHTTTWNSIDVTVEVDLTLPALGYKTLIVKQANQAEPVRHPSVHKIGISSNCLQNEVLKITVEKDGSLTLFDKRNGQIYTDLMTFEENADIGDGWYHGMAVNDCCYNSIGANSQVSTVSNGAELATLKISKIMRLPETFCFDSMRRSDNLKEFVIDNYVTLRKNSDRIEVETRINNNVKDHRIRVNFPTQAQTEKYVADSVFDVVEYPIAIDKDNYKKKELQTDTQPQQSWTAICDSKRGLAVISPGQYETAVSNDADRAIKLTLFRSTQRTVMTSGEPDGQLQKPLDFKYWIVPLAENYDHLKLFKYASYLALGIKSIQFRKDDMDILASEIVGKLPVQQGNLCVKNAVMTSLRKCKDKLYIRVFNPLDVEQSARIELLSDKMQKLKSAVSVDLEGNTLGNSIGIEDCCLKFEINPKQIMTLCLG